MSLLEVRELGKRFGGVRAVDGISFDIAAGELLALIGPNGAGKSTTFNMVNGQLRADSGSIRLEGRELTGLAPRADLGAGRRPHLPDRRDLRLPDGAGERADGAARGRPPGVLVPGRRAADHRRDDALDLLSQVGMASQAGRPCSVLAYGDVKRLELAIALAHGPRLLLMDEPTAGMAPASAWR
jgi:branched-chain amino acid transport system ATP-binding protein